MPVHYETDGAPERDDMPALPPKNRYLSPVPTLLLTLPTLLLSLLVLFVVGELVGRWAAAVIAVLWVYFGAVVVNGVWFRPNRKGLARRAFRLRAPVSPETERLAAAWANVTSRPGLDGWPYSLWVQQSDELNAFAAPARMVGATSWAIAKLAPRQLEAILAHELGHHLVVDARARLFDVCLAMPAVFLRRLGERGGRLLEFLGDRAPAVRFLVAVGAAVAAVLASIPVLRDGGAAVLGVLLFVEPLARAAQSRREESAADLVAVDLGYGYALMAALRRWIESSPPPPSGVLAVRDRLFSTHPPMSRRLRAIEDRMRERPCGTEL
ncbi:M48 family metalloprotease [Nocardia sp. NPDC052566]|uniref:M48 family metalloprotease n=1 Tax=Nocardia sp. NPDC052566 TaxID=3364330 RepID=UPI0037C596BF